jgi:hypothetical protein
MEPAGSQVLAADLYPVPDEPDPKICVLLLRDPIISILPSARRYSKLFLPFSFFVPKRPMNLSYLSFVLMPCPSHSFELTILILFGEKLRSSS